MGASLFQIITFCVTASWIEKVEKPFYEGWNFNSGNYLFTNDTK